MLRNMSNITIEKINNKAVRQLTTLIGLREIIFDKEIAYLFYQWDGDELIIQTNGRTKYISKWLKFIKFDGNLKYLRKIFFEDFGLSIFSSKDYKSDYKKPFIKNKTNALFFEFVFMKPKTEISLSKIMNLVNHPTKRNNFAKFILNLIKNPGYKDVYCCNFLMSKN